MDQIEVRILEQHGYIHSIRCLLEDRREVSLHALQRIVEHVRNVKRLPNRDEGLNRNMVKPVWLLHQNLNYHG